MARCIHGRQVLPGPECTCGIRFYPHTGGLIDKVATRAVGMRADGFLRGEPAYWGTRVFSYGIPVGPCYQDPKTGNHGSWRQYWRTGRYDVLALLAWPEYPLDALAGAHGNVPVFTFGNGRSPTETLRWVASNVRPA